MQTTSHRNAEEWFFGEEPVNEVIEFFKFESVLKPELSKELSTGAVKINLEKHTTQQDTDTITRIR